MTATTSGKWVKSSLDGLGRLWKVFEPQPGSGGTTQSRTFVSDREQKLSAVTQPETGTVTYTYDLLSRTSTKTDAKNQKVQYIYL